MAKHFSLLLLLLLSCLAYGQKGAISGTVLDENGESLPGANVLIEGTTIGAQTDFIEGRYQFQADPGIYTIIASFIGYADVKIEGVVVNAKETTLLDIVFDPEAAGGVNLEEVVVKADALERGTVAVLKLRQNDVNAKDIISQQEISSLGIGNVSGAMAKVTGTTVVDGKYVYVRGLGDRYSATTINGLRLPSIDPYRNSAQLDLIPTSILDNISASKTFTPDLPGDFTGGSVDVRIKALPERFTWGVSFGTSYNDLSNFQSNFRTYEGNDAHSFGYSGDDLALPIDLNDPQLNELGAFSRDAGRIARRDDELAAAVEQVADAFDNPFNIAREQTPLDYSFSANIGNQFQLGSMPLGVFATVSASRDYSFYDNGVNAQYRTLEPGATTLQEFFDLRENSSTENTDVGGMVGLNLRLSPANNLSFYTLYSHQGSANVTVSEGSFESKGVSGELGNNFYGQGSGFLERELTDYVLQGEHTLTGLNNIRIDWTANYVTSSQNEPDYRYLEFIRQETTLENDRSSYRQPSRFFRDLTDETYEGKVDITIPVLNSKDRGNAIKLGGQFRSKERDFNEQQIEYTQRGGTPFSRSEENWDLYFGDENTGIIGGEAGRNDIGVYVINTTTDGNSYVGTDEITAGYLMGTFSLTERLKVTAGLRVENTFLDIRSDQADIVTDSATLSLLTATIDRTNYMPAANLVFNTFENHNLRASYSQTVARPNMREIAPFASFNGVDPTVVGNVNLGLTTIDNFDLRYEIFPEGKPGELYSVSAFYKQFTDPIVVTFLPGGGGGIQYTWTNTEQADLYGIEFELRKNLGFIAPGLNNFTFSNNLALIRSNQDIAPSELEQAQNFNENFPSSRPFSGQSDFVINANLAYTTTGDNPWDAIVAFNYFSDRLQLVGGPAGSPDVYEQGRAQLDLSVSKAISNFKVSLRARNLINPDFRTFSTFFDQEYDFSRYQRGREVSLSVSYGI